MCLLILIFFSQPLENVESIPGLPATQKPWAAGQMGLRGRHPGDAPCLSFLIGTEGALMAPVARHGNGAWHVVHAGEGPRSGIGLWMCVAKGKRGETR